MREKVKSESKPVVRSVRKRRRTSDKAGIRRRRMDGRGRAGLARHRCVDKKENKAMSITM